MKPVSPTIARIPLSARNVQDFDPFEHALVGSASAFSSERPAFCQRRLLPVAAAPGSRDKVGGGILHRRLPGRPRGTAQLLLDRLAQVLDQMEAVGDLPGLWRAPARSLGIKTAAIAANDFDPGMLVKPLSRSFSRAIRQHVDHLSSLQIHNNRPAAATLSPAPVINASHPNRSGFATLSLMAFELPQNGVVALWKTETRHRPLRRPPPGSVADQMSEFTHPTGSPGKRPGDPRK